jgi:hypothetical protein
LLEDATEKDGQRVLTGLHCELRGAPKKRFSEKFSRRR